MTLRNPPKVLVRTRSDRTLGKQNLGSMAVKNMEYTGIVMNYSIGAKMQYAKRMIIMVSGTTSHESRGLVGAKVAWPYDKPIIYGKINKIHGARNGYLLATFKKGLPGDAIGKNIKIIKK